LSKRVRSPADRALHLIKQHGLVPAGEKVVVAVSGGADSVCLLHTLVCHREALGIELHLAHLNHQLRQAESDADAKYVSRLAHEMGVPATVECRDVAAYQRQTGCSLEEAAREVRYCFLDEVADAVHASRVAVGHTCDDHVETILMHLLRGSGTAGLRGLQPRSLLRYRKNRSPLEVVRPLLEVTRQETADYCRQHNLKPRTDSSNVSPDFLRNRIRLELLPLLRTYNPGIDDALLRLAATAGDDAAYIEAQASQAWNEVSEKEKGAIHLDARLVDKLPRPIQRQLFRMAIRAIKGNLKDIEAGHIEAMVSFLAKPAGKLLCLPENLRLTTGYGRLVLSSDLSYPVPLPDLEKNCKLNVPGDIVFPGWRVRAEIVEGKFHGGEDRFSASFDLRKAGTELMVRRRQPGDRLQPLGMGQVKKLQDFMVDARIPRMWRDRVPLVCSPAQILWVVGWRIDDRVKVTEATEKTLSLTFERTPHGIV